MTSFFDAVKEKLGNAYCTVSDFQVWIASQASVILEGTSAEGAAQIQEELYRYWNQLACGVDPMTPLPSDFDEQFPNGQCEGTRYLITGTYEQAFRSNGAIERIQGFNAGIHLGPITKIRITPDTPLPASNAEAIVQGVRTNLFSVSNNRKINRIVSVTLTPQGSDPDNCGGPGAELNPTNQPLTDVTDIDYQDENGNPQTAEGVEFTFGLPILEPDGTISVPYEVCYEGFCLKGKLNFGAELKVIPEPPFKTEEPNDNLLEEISDLLDEKDRTDEVLEKLCEILDAIEDLENNQDFHIVAFEEQIDRTSGTYLSFKMLDVEAQNFPRSTSEDTRYPYVLPNCRTDITVEELANIEFKKGDSYCWIDPEGVNIQGHLFKAYFASKSDGYSALNNLYSLTAYSTSGISSHRGNSERESPKKNKLPKTLRMVSAVLYNSENNTILKAFTSADFEDYYQNA